MRSHTAWIASTQRSRGTVFAVLLGAVLLGTGGAAAQSLNPYPRQHIADRPVLRWEFADTAADATADATAGWQATHDTAVRVGGGALRITSKGNDPYLIGPAFHQAGPLVIRLRLKSTGGGPGQFFWQSAADPRWIEQQSVRFDLRHDGAWHDYTVAIDEPRTFTRLRFDPGTVPGMIEVAWIRVLHRVMHPLEITAVGWRGAVAQVTVHNHGDAARKATCGGDTAVLAPGSDHVFHVREAGRSPFYRLDVSVGAPELPTIRRWLVGSRPEALRSKLRLRAGTAELLLAEDGSGAVLRLGGRPVATIAPIVAGVTRWRRAGMVLRSPGVTVRFAAADGWFTCDIESDRDVEGPVVRPIGALQQGLFGGQEYLGRGERSSSTLDIETPEHVRIEPDPMQVTIPLMACVTDRGATAVLWRDPELQPVFASPNVFDGLPDHRMSLRGKRISVAILAQTTDLDQVLLEAVRRHGLPPLPRAPRDTAAQERLCLAALDGPLRDENGWGHCQEARWPRRPFAAMASTIWRLTGRMPELARLQQGGAHVDNDAAFFVTGRVGQWLAASRGHARAIARQQRPDGSFGYTGKYRRGHFEDTASGYCGKRAVELLEFAYLTGDGPARDAGLEALNFARRFRTPRGAQTWELSLHTPDILAAAHLVRAHVLAYRLTGERRHIDQAHNWALRGLPFVYLWSSKPVMAYATIPVFGATNWRAPNWIGRPVQWCGGVYAYALAGLAPYDDALDWRRVARGILIAGEQMQYPDGAKAGCLPDFFSLRHQQRAGPTINPCALMSLRLVLDDKLDSLAVATANGRRVTAPFPVQIRGNKAVVSARAGQHYSLLIDGARIIDVISRGRDEITCWDDRDKRP